MKYYHPNAHAGAKNKPSKALGSTLEAIAVEFGQTWCM